MGKFPEKSIFVPKNPEKYIGTTPIVMRSSWERTFAEMCDEHPNILQWSSESLAIPYINPFDKRRHLYYPDFFIIFMDKKGNKRGEVIEIKPSTQTLLEKAKTAYDQVQLAINAVKWDAATKYCQRRGLFFRVLTEDQLYKQGITSMGGKYGRTKPRKTPVNRKRKVTRRPRTTKSRRR